MSEDSIRDEHVSISRFVVTRLLPMIDDYIKARGFQHCGDSAALFYLARRMYLRGVPVENITELVTSAVSQARKALAGGETDPPLPLTDFTHSLDSAPLSTPGKVIAFRPKT